MSAVAGVAHAGAACLAALVMAAVGRALVRWLAQPPVIGEIIVGLAIGPLVVAAAGPALLDRLLPAPVLSTLSTVGELGLAWFLVGVAYHVRPRSVGYGRRAFGWVTAGASVPSLVAGAVVAGWLAWRGVPELRGDAPLPAFVLMLAIALAVTAVPVLARILQSRRFGNAPEGVLALATAITIDAVIWLLLAVALALAAGSPRQSALTAVTLTVGVAATLLLRVRLRAGAGTQAVNRRPAATALALAAVTVLVASITNHYGLTVVLGAVLVGFAVPSPDPRGEGGWVRPVRIVERVGRFLVPVFFVTTGIRLLVDPPGGLAWAPLVAMLAVAAVTKIAGSYLGARLGGLQPVSALRLGLLMNTRGLTEIAVLHAGLDAGIITPGLFLLLVIVAMAMTVATGPLLGVLDRLTGGVAGGCAVLSSQRPTSWLRS